MERTYFKNLPKDLTNLVEEYRIKNNPNNKFFELFKKLQEEGNPLGLDLDKMVEFEFPDLPIQFIDYDDENPDSHIELNIYNDLPFIDDKLFEKFLKALIKNDKVKMYQQFNSLLKVAETNFRVVDYDWLDFEEKSFRDFKPEIVKIH